MSAIRIVVLGDHKVGKSAVTVRYLTQRFIGEYSSDIDLLYRATIKLEDTMTDIEVLDTCTKPMALEFRCQYFDVSAAENAIGITVAFQALLKEARLAQHQRNALIRRRKTSLSNVSKRLGAMFGKKDPNSNSLTDGGGTRSSVDT